jgi:hypothetical protein
MQARVSMHAARACHTLPSLKPCRRGVIPGCRHRGVRARARPRMAPTAIERLVELTRNLLADRQGLQQAFALLADVGPAPGAPTASLLTSNGSVQPA